MTPEPKSPWPALVRSVAASLAAGATVRIAGDTARLDLPGRGTRWVSIEHFEAARALVESGEGRA